MADNNRATAKSNPSAPADAGIARSEETIKGKDKMLNRNTDDDTANTVGTEDDDDDDIEEDDDGAPIDVEEDAMEEIDTSNIIAGRRTRGRVIDFAKAAEQTPADGDDDEEDDEDFHANDKMDED